MKMQIHYIEGEHNEMQGVGVTREMEGISMMKVRSAAEGNRTPPSDVVKFGEERARRFSPSLRMINVLDRVPAHVRQKVIIIGRRSTRGGRIGRERIGQLVPWSLSLSLRFKGRGRRWVQWGLNISLSFARQETLSVFCRRTTIACSDWGGRIGRERIGQLWWSR
ncbi:hypothetical protein CPB85DRAFT_1340992 [Mucidula mucida]|nr:hypothetical protein CPB85DRAFT_1340992 [Mucidula mucida]